MSHLTDNLVVECMDHRFHRIVRDHLDREFGVDVDRSDRLIDAGASSAVTEDGLLDRCPLAQRLHGIKNVFIYDHLDCGAFGGLKAFNNDEQREMEAHIDSQKRAAEAISKILPSLVIRTFVINLDGEVVAHQTSL